MRLSVLDGELLLKAFFEDTIYALFKGKLMPGDSLELVYVKRLIP